MGRKRVMGTMLVKLTVPIESDITGQFVYSKDVTKETVYLIRPTIQQLEDQHSENCGMKRASKLGDSSQQSTHQVVHVDVIPQ